MEFNLTTIRQLDRPLLMANVTMTLNLCHQGMVKTILPSL